MRLCDHTWQVHWPGGRPNAWKSHLTQMWDRLLQEFKFTCWISSFIWPNYFLSSIPTFCGYWRRRSCFVNSTGIYSYELTLSFRGDTGLRFWTILKLLRPWEGISVYWLHASGYVKQVLVCIWRLNMYLWDMIRYQFDIGKIRLAWEPSKEFVEHISGCVWCDLR